MREVRFIVWGLLLSMVTVQVANAQEVSVTIANENVGIGLEDEVKLQIRDRVALLMSEYQKLGQFASVSDYVNFELILSDDPTLFNDIEVKPKRPDIELIDYLSKAQTSLMDYGGFPFDLVNLNIIQMGVSANQLYFAKVEGTKVIQQKIDKNGFPRSGPYNEKMTWNMEINPYDFEDAYIYAIEGSSAAKSQSDVVFQQDADSRLTIALKGGLGAIYNGMPTQSSILSEAKSSLSSYGVEINYRRNLDSKYKYYLIAGVSGEFAQVSTDLSALDLSSVDNGLPLDGATIPYQEGYFTGGISDKEQASASLLPIEFVDGEEDLSLNIIQGRLGLGYTLYDNNFTKKLFLDAVLIGNFMSTRSQGDITGTLFGIRIPDQDGLAFPTVDQLKTNGIINNVEDIQPSDILVDEYKGSRSFLASQSEFDIQPQSNFSLALSIAPTYHYQITKSLGIMAGIDYTFSITSLFNNTDIENDLFVGDNFRLRTNSVLEDYFEVNRMGRLSAKAGIFFRF